MQRTTIQWATHTINPIRARVAGSTTTKGGYAAGVGHYCEKISPGCRGCYASEIQPRFGLPQFQEQRGAGAPEVFLDVSKLNAVLRARAPAKIFWCDMTDLFGGWVPDAWIAACFGVMAATPQHVHQVLTKRADRLPRWFQWAGSDARRICDLEAKQLGVQLPLGYEATPWPLPNVHLGVSVENQKAADERVPLLLKTPAAVRWVSAEPLIGPVDLLGIDEDGNYGPGWMLRSVQNRTDYGTGVEYDVDAQFGLDWVVVGGESGRRARLFDLAWARSIRDQCRVAGIPVFIKQLGRRPIADRVPYVFKDRHGGTPDEWPEDLRVRQFPCTEPTPA